jgi:hypothetical protein
VSPAVVLTLYLLVTIPICATIRRSRYAAHKEVQYDYVVLCTDIVVSEDVCSVTQGLAGNGVTHTACGDISWMSTYVLDTFINIYRDLETEAG